MKQVKSLVFYCLALVLSTSSLAQDSYRSEYNATTSTQTIQHENGLTYKVKITTPPNYDKDTRYHVVYYLDSWWLSEIILGANALSYLSKNTAPLIMVGISAQGDQATWHKQRTFDYTPSPYDLGFNFKIGDMKIDSNNTGGADQFITFLEQKIFPMVENNYATYTADRGFIGHSFGGLFGIYSSQQRPDLFKNMIIISPAVWWNESELVQERAFKKLLNSKTEVGYFISVGGKEFKLLLNAVQKLDILLTEMKSKFIKYHYKLYENRDHTSLIPSSVYDGLIFFYSNHTIKK